MKLSKEECRDKILELSNQTDGSVTIDLLKERRLYYAMLKYWKNLTAFKDEYGLLKKQTYDGKMYSKDELIQVLKDFYNKTNIVPNSSFIETYNKEYGLPSRKTFMSKLDVSSWKDVLLICGLDVDKSKVIKKYEKRPHDDKGFIINIIHEYIDKYGKVPTLKEIDMYYGTSLKDVVKKHFGGWNNCLTELGLSLNSVQKYTDEELDNAFLRFIEEFNRVPTIQDFNKTGRPSFWCYQQRFGSWAETCIHYGFEPNCRKSHYYMDDGERCDSRFEYDISTWLKSKGITYDRDIPYVDFTNNYNGKMNCDYRFTLDNGQIWYVEMAGFIDTDDFTKLTSREEELYFFKLKYKKKLFRENNLNYKIFHPSDLKNHTMEELFDFLNIKKTA